MERPGEHLDAGLERLAGVVDAPAGDPQELCDRVLRELVPDGGAPDDVALLTLHTIPMADSFSVELPTQPEALASMRALLRRWLRNLGTEEDISEIVTACGEAATNAIEHAGAGGAVRDERADPRAQGGNRGARLRRLARGARGRPRPGALADGGIDGYR